VIYEEYLTPMNYVARTHLHRRRHGMRIHDKFLKLHTTRLLPWSVHATWSMKHDTSKWILWLICIGHQHLH